MNMFNDADSNRNKWVFDVSVHVLTGAVSRKLDYHAERVGYWKDKQAEALRTLRTQGIVLDTKVDLNLSASYYQESISLDPKLKEALSTAQAKVLSHEDKMRSYQIFQNALAHKQHDDTFPCTVSDMEFFGL